jgi:P-type Cu+ transporter
VPKAVGLPRAPLRNIRQNLFWAFACNAALIRVAAGVLCPLNGTHLSPMLAAGAMALSSVFVLGNALRFKRFAPVSPAPLARGGPCPPACPEEAPMSHSPIDIYTTPTCPDCATLTRWLSAQGIHFVERDLSNPRIADAVRRRNGLRIAPITLFDGKANWGTTAEQLPRLRRLLAADQAL